MRQEIARPLAVLAAVSSSMITGFAESSEIAIWRGELHSDSRRLFRGCTVELSDDRSHSRARAEVGADGSFEFRRIATGFYRMTVYRADGQELYRSIVAVSGGPGDVEVRLPEEQTERPPSAGVSVLQLLHPPSRKAVALVVAARKLSLAGEYGKAALELEKAVHLSPEYGDAHVNLGAQYLRLNRNQEALDELEEALRIGPPTALALSNLAFAQYALARDADAIRSARWSLRMEPDCAPAHYVLGIALARSGQSMPEAIAHLERASESIPTARANLERMRAQSATK